MFEEKKNKEVLPSGWSSLECGSDEGSERPQSGCGGGSASRSCNIHHNISEEHNHVRNIKQGGSWWLLPPPLAGRAPPQLLQVFPSLRQLADGGERRGRWRDAVLGHRLITEEVRRKQSQQSFRKLRAQTVVDVGQDSGNCRQESAGETRRTTYTCCPETTNWNNI